MLKRDDLLRISQEHDLMPRLKPNGSPVSSPEIERRAYAHRDEEVEIPPNPVAVNNSANLKSVGKSKTLPRLQNPFKSRKKLEKLASTNMIVENVDDPQISNNPPSQPVRSRADCTSVPVKPNVMQAYL